MPNQNQNNEKNTKKNQQNNKHYQLLKTNKEATHALHSQELDEIFAFCHETAGIAFKLDQQLCSNVKQHDQKLQRVPNEDEKGGILGREQELPCFQDFLRVHPCGNNCHVCAITATVAATNVTTVATATTCISAATTAATTAASTLFRSVLRASLPATRLHKSKSMEKTP